MVANLLYAIPFIFGSLISLISALPNVTVTQIGQGDCSAYPNSYFHAGDNADAFVFSPDQADDSSINNLTTGIIGTNLVVYNDSTVVSTIFCCDRGNVLDGFGVRNLLVSTNTTDEDLGYLSQGLRPETYTHKVDGVAQDGVFLGMSNVTAWGFRPSGDSSYYQLRLLAPGIGDPPPLYDGEIRGFLKVVPPS